MKEKVLVALLCGALIGAAPVYASENQTDGTWSEDLCASGYVGSGGVGETTEWNRKTPPDRRMHRSSRGADGHDHEKYSDGLPDHH